MDNDIADFHDSESGRLQVVKSIQVRARLKVEDDRLRGNLMGKHVDFSSRTAITGDPDLY